MQHVTPSSCAQPRTLRKLAQRLAFFYKEPDVEQWLALTEAELEAATRECREHWTKTRASEVLRTLAWGCGLATALAMGASVLTDTGSTAQPMTLSAGVLTLLAVLFVAGVAAGVGAILGLGALALANGGREQALVALEPAGISPERCAKVLELVHEHDSVRAYRDGLLGRERTLRQFDLGRMELLAFLAREEARKQSGRSACLALHGLA